MRYGLRSASVAVLCTKCGPFLQLVPSVKYEVVNESNVNSVGPPYFKAVPSVC